MFYILGFGWGWRFEDTHSRLNTVVSHHSPLVLYSLQKRSFPKQSLVVGSRGVAKGPCMVQECVRAAAEDSLL